MTIPFNPNDTGESAANAAVAITYAALADRSHLIWSIEWSYDGTPTGSIAITVSGTAVFQQDVRAAGPGAVTFEPPQKAARNAEVIVTLAAGGAGVVGKVNITHSTEA